MQKRPVGPKKAKPKGATKPRGEGPLRKLARTVDTAMKDADAARRSAFDPEFKQGLGKDRRSTLSRFRTVKQALADRQRLEQEKEGKKPSG